MRLQHIHLPSSPPTFPTYRQAASLQEHLRRQLLDAKETSSHAKHPPPPSLISFTPQPTFTLGRRQTSPLTPAEVARLRAPLHVRFSATNSGSGDSDSDTYNPAIISSPRGGLATYHGPGQIVLWTVADLHAAGRPPLSVRCYSRLLEDATSRVLERLFGLTTTTATADPGVWVHDSKGGGWRKVAAMGVHLRRHVSALGVAVNLDMPTDGRGGDETTSPWARIVACGLEGKGVTSVAGELGRDVLLGVHGGAERAVAEAWAEEMARGLGVDGVETVGDNEMAALLETTSSDGVAGLG